MDLFFLDQRWSSETEPELGVGIVTETSKGRVKLEFLAAGETRMYATGSAPLRRVRFKVGDTITDMEGRSIVIEQLQEGERLIIYFGQGRILSEGELGNVVISHGADDRLLAGDVDSIQEFALRRKTLEYDHDRRISSINGFVGGRIDLVPHQLYIAHEVSSRYAPRVLLSDEVGLGKTIEACLILHRLLLSGRISRVLILVPDSLVHQWFVEVLRRFNLWFNIFDEERCAAIEEGAPEGNPFLDDQLVLCSIDFLANSKLRAKQAMAAQWDMLVVDEAHHLKWSVEHVDRAYSVVELLSKVANGLLLLTATPEQLGEESHFARLRLLDPERYSDYEAFKKMPQDHRATADIVLKLLEGGKLATNEKKALESWVGKDRLDAALQKGGAERELLAQDLLDQYGPGRVVFRNTRASMQGFPQRIPRLAPLAQNEASEDAMRQLANEFGQDAQSSHENQKALRFDFDHDIRLDWLIDLMNDSAPAKVLLICSKKAKVLALEKALRTRGNLKVGVFHEDLSLIQRDRNAAWFSEPEGARLLLCSEIGSEGRNFQFAHHLVLFDLPMHPELLEQRIGRLDRIGQTEDIQIHIPYVTGSPQEVLVRWYHDGLNAFVHNLVGGNKIADRFGDRLHATAQAMQTDNSNALCADLIADTKAFHQELRATLANGRDRLLEMNSFRPALAEKLIEQIRAEDHNPRLETFTNHVFEQFAVEVEDLAPRTYRLHGRHGGAGVLPAIPDEGLTVTFDRKRALSREEVSFLSWDHPMVTGAIDMVISTGTGSASFATLSAVGPPAILLEVLFVLETAGTQNQDIDRFLPSTPLRIVVDHSGKDVTEQYPAEVLDRRLRPGEIDDLLENETLVEAVIPKMIAAATEFAELQGMKEIVRGLRKMNLTMDHEINRLKSLQEKNQNIRPTEIKIAEEAQANFAAIMKEANVRMDALQLIQKGEV